MTTEQKAKAYDEALERMKSWVKGEYPECFTEAQKAAEFIFPELKESEDERIRKGIIRVLKGEISFVSEKENEKYIAWLEKQGEEEKIDTQNCVNPTNNPESKFYEEDWIAIDEDDNPCQIINIDNKENYIVQYCNDEETHVLSKNFCESHYHLWTIQDAKDGDVLASDNGVIILVKESRGSSWGHRLSYHCAVLYDGTFEPREFHVNPEKFFPATKEQRDLLFSKMKEAGYEWDAEKKELKKIKMTDLFEDYNRLLSIKWSEYDSAKLQACIDSLQAKCLMGKVDTVLTNWLKSLKERISG